MKQLAENTWIQQIGEGLSDCIGSSKPSHRKFSFVHICNPFQAEPQQREIQEVAFASMKQARSFKNGKGDITPEVQFLAAVFSEDEAYALTHFDRTTLLKRSTQDLQRFKNQRNLPLLFDVLAGAENVNADYVVFTNVDICLVPHFYLSVDTLLNFGYDSLIINRRTLLGWPSDPQLINLMALDPGDAHEGYDCFVFPRHFLKALVKGNLAIGTGGVMQGLIFNMVALSKRMLILEDVHLTWHLGDDKLWAKTDLLEYTQHNWQENMRILKVLAKSLPDRFIRFSKNFHKSRVDIIADQGGAIRIQRKANSKYNFPNTSDLELINKELKKSGQFDCMKNVS